MEKQRIDFEIKETGSKEKSKHLWILRRQESFKRRGSKQRLLKNNKLKKKITRIWS